MLIAYNQEQFITEAVQGAFSQTYSPLEIILSDDCSPDRTFEIMQEMAAQYQGPHTIVVNRNERNLGLIGHINRVMEFANGELIVAAAGDDISLPKRSEHLANEYLTSGREAYSLFSNGVNIDNIGRPLNLIQKNRISTKELSLTNYASRAKPGFINGCTHAWRKETFSFFGPLPNYVQTEDTTIPFRSLLLGKVLYLHDPLVLYRRDIDRIKNKYGFFSYSKFRERINNNREGELATFKCRLSDLELFMSLSNGENKSNLEEIKKITKNLINNHGYYSENNRHLTYEFVRMVMYYQYQNIKRYFFKFESSKISDLI